MFTEQQNFITAKRQRKNDNGFLSSLTQWLTDCVTAWLMLCWWRSCRQHSTVTSRRDLTYKWQWMISTRRNHSTFIAASSSCSPSDVDNVVSRRLHHSSTSLYLLFSNRRQSRDYNCDSTTTRLRYDYDVSRAPACIRRDSTRAKKLTCQFFVVVVS